MLQEKDLLLRPLLAKDRNDLVLFMNNKKIWDNLRDFIPFPYSLEDAYNFIQMTNQENPHLTFAIELGGRFCGMIGILKQSDIYRLTGEIGYWIGEPFWGKGIATRALKLMTDYGFSKLDLVRIHTGVFEHNVGSMKVLEKCAYKKDCILEKSIIKNGKILNEHRYSIVQ